MWNLREDEVARKIPASELTGVWNHDLPVPEGMVGLLLVNEKLDRVYGPGTLRVSSGLAQFFGLGTKNAVVLARAHELSLDFAIAHVRTGDYLPLDFNCQLLSKLQQGAETLFLRNILAGRELLTFDDLKQRLNGELKEVAQSFLGKRSIADLADHLEIKPELEAQIELNLKRTLNIGGLTFIGLRTAHFRCPAWDRRKEGEVLITEAQAALEGKKRLAEVFTQAELADLAEETRKVEQYEQRIQLWDRMRRAAQSDKMNEVRSEQEMDRFLRDIDKDMLLKESELEELKRSLIGKFDDQERTRIHVVRIAVLKNEYELKNLELSLHSGYTGAQQQAEAERQVKSLEAELRQLDIKLEIERTKNKINQAQLGLESKKAEPRPGEQPTLIFDGVAVRSTIQQIGTINIGPSTADPGLYLRLGNLALESKRYTEAVGYFEQALALDSRCTAAWLARGLALFELGRYHEAIDSYDKAIAIDPKLAKAWNNRGYALQKLGRNEEAKKSFARATELSQKKT